MYINQLPAPILLFVKREGFLRNYALEMTIIIIVMIMIIMIIIIISRRHLRH